MPLKVYQQKRSFKKTPEPKGKIQSTKNKNLYVIQKHAASHLHYDFRLELNGTLVSWAVPKGPSLDPNIKRLAVHVEDHPLEYGYFEGAIPKGEYGGGTVMLWDTGEWFPDSDNIYKDYQKGNLKFTLKGKKLKGLWKLVQLKSSPKNWLLIKGKDKYSRESDEYDITLEKPKSVKTKKTIDALAKQFKQNLPTEAPKKQTQSSLLLNENILSHPNKILYPDSKITKLNLFEYYKNIYPWMLPYVINRPLSLVRCPAGYQNKCFFQKHINASTSSHLKVIKIKDSTKKTNYIYIDNKEGLLALPQLNVLEIHTWGSQVTSIAKPDMVIFDLDPAPDISWKTLVKAALDIKNELKKYKLISFVKTTGGKGLHVVVPIMPEYNWDKVKLFAHTFVKYLVSKHPDKYIDVMSKSKRKNKIFIDYLRNARGATAIAPFSTRARPKATVAVPIGWDELILFRKNPEYTIKTIFKRLKNLTTDPWKDFFKIKQSLRLDKL